MSEQPSSANPNPNPNPPAARGRVPRKGGAAAAERSPAGGAAEGLNRRHLLQVMTRLKKGDFTVRLEAGTSGVDGRLADAFNEVVELNERMASSCAPDPRRRQGGPHHASAPSLGDVRGPGRPRSVGQHA